VSLQGEYEALDVSDCTGITDVSALHSMPKLILVGCSGVPDFTANGT